ncbi:MAG: ABC transporter permease, partial [Halobaculum sp.]
MATKTYSESEAAPFGERVRTNPRPALIWVGVTTILLALEAGALIRFGALVLGDTLAAIPGMGAPATLNSIAKAAGEMPTLLSRETIPNAGYYTGSGYEGTFAGLAPHLAWTLRVTLIYLYSFSFVAWIWVGYDWYRQHYRVADWTPRDDVVDRLRGHGWGIFGFLVVFMFIVMAVFAPALGPTTVAKNIQDPYGHEIKYYDTETNSVETILVGQANLGSQSKGTPQTNVGPWSYDDFGRFHPFGTLPSGKDLFTFI